MSDSEIAIVCADGETFRVSLTVAKGSSFIQSIIDQTPDSTESIHLPAVQSSQFVHVLRFLEKQAVEPITRLKRPLPKANFASCAAPDWAIEFGKSIPLGTDMLDIIEAASFLGVVMMEQLLCARIAAEVMKVPLNMISELRTTVSEDMRDEEGNRRKLTPAEEKLLKEQNRWAWENEITDFIA